MTYRTHNEEKFGHVFSRLGTIKNHQVFSTFISSLISVQEKGRRVAVHIQEMVEAKIRTFVQEGHIVKLYKCTSANFISPRVLTARKYGTVKLAMDE